MKKLDNAISARRLLHHVLKEKSWEPLEGIKDSEFLGKAKIVLASIREYYGESEEFPPADYIEDLTSIPFPSEISLTVAKKRFLDWQKVKQLGDIVDKAQSQLADQRPDDAIETLSQVNLMQGLVRNSGLINVNETALQRHVDFKEKKEDNNEYITTPFPTWTKNILGFEKGTLSAILGISHVGKSWLSVACAIDCAYKQNKNVLLVSMENTTDSILNRIDAKYNSLDFKDLRTGMMDDRIVKRWGESAQTMQDSTATIWVTGAADVRSVSDIYQKVVKVRPDFVIVDGAYKLAGVEWVESSKLIQDLCDYSAISKVPWLVTSQLKMGANDEKGGREQGFQASGNTKWYVDLDTVLTVTQTPELNQLGVIKCRIVKDRDAGDKTGISSEFYLSMDLNWSKIEEFDLDSYESSEILTIT